LMGFLSYAVSRWRDFLQQGCFRIQGRIHDVGLLIGAALVAERGNSLHESLRNGENESAAKEPAQHQKVPDEPTEVFLEHSDSGNEATEIKATEIIESQLVAFKIYRYLNLVHFLTYNGTCEKLTTLGIGLDNLLHMNLVTQSEVRTLLPAKDKQREVVLTWMATEIQYAINAGLLGPQLGTAAQLACARLRGACAGFKDLFDVNHPNTWISLMRFVVDVLVLLFVIASPVNLFVVESPVQYWTLFSVLLLIFPFLCTATLISKIKDPFNGGFLFDAYNADALMCSTERTIFQSLRTRTDYTNLTEQRRLSHVQSFTFGEGMGVEMLPTHVQGLHHKRSKKPHHWKANRDYPPLEFGRNSVHGAETAIQLQRTSAADDMAAE